MKRSHDNLDFVDDTIRDRNYDEGFLSMLRILVLLRRFGDDYESYVREKTPHIEKALRQEDRPTYAKSSFKEIDGVVTTLQSAHNVSQIKRIADEQEVELNQEDLEMIDKQALDEVADKYLIDGEKPN